MHWLVLALALAAQGAASGRPDVWLDVPYVEQEKNGCGAAAVAMVMQYWQKDADAMRIRRELHPDEAKGIFASSIVRYLEGHGFRAFVFSAEFSDLEQHLAKGRPLIVALAPERARGPLHYVVVAGLAPGAVLVNDPAQRKLARLRRADFARRWQATRNWSLLAVPHSAS